MKKILAFVWSFAFAAVVMAAATPTSTLFKAIGWRQAAQGVILLPVLDGSGALIGWKARGTICLEPDPAQVSGPLPTVCNTAVVTLSPTSTQNTYLKTIIRDVVQAAGATANTN